MRMQYFFYCPLHLSQSSVRCRQRNSLVLNILLESHSLPHPDFLCISYAYIIRKRRGVRDGKNLLYGVGRARPLWSYFWLRRMWWMCCRPMTFDRGRSHLRSMRTLRPTSSAAKSYAIGSERHSFASRLQYISDAVAQISVRPTSMPYCDRKWSLIQSRKH